MLSRPLRLTLNLTGRCNLNCRYCYVSQRDELETVEWLKLIENAGKIGIFRISFTGGEPLLYDGWRKLIDATVSNRMRFSISSNGILIDDETAEFIAHTERCDHIQISLDGTEELHDACRGDGSWRQALSAIRRLQKYQVKVILRMTLTPIHVGRLRETFRTMFDELDLPLTTVNIARDVEGRFAVPKPVFWALLEEVVELYPQYRHRLSPYGAVSRHQEWQRMLDGVEPGGTFQSCSGGEESLYVRSNGEISLCMFHQKCLGRINRDKIEDIWQNHPALLEIRRMSGKALTEFAACEKCSWVSFCRGFCPGNRNDCLNFYKERWNGKN